MASSSLPWEQLGVARMSLLGIFCWAEWLNNKHLCVADIATHLILHQDIADVIKNLVQGGLAKWPKMKLEWDLLDFF